MSDEPTDENDPIKESPLHDLLRAYTPEEMQVGGDSSAYVKLQLENTIEVVWQEAVKNAKDRDRKTVEEQDVRAAYNEIFYPYTLLEEAATKMGEYQLELQRTANKSPVLETEIEEDE
ncbi:hypothetical protein [Haladaptatus halobius]|uniref:hypothetical protein n=1 Tax=Haladaptatus halobius TaxID=2884875 RepID=UPI001D0B9672|nr:hypothetical protein [Haladaptatus halobius]